MWKYILPTSQVPNNSKDLDLIPYHWQRVPQELDKELAFANIHELNTLDFEYVGLFENAFR